MVTNPDASLLLIPKNLVLQGCIHVGSPSSEPEQAYQSGYWEQVMQEDDMAIDTKILVNIENDFCHMLEENNYYPTLPIPPDDPAYRFHYAGDLAIPPNAFIAHLCHLQTKSTMYSHIQVLRERKFSPLTQGCR